MTQPLSPRERLIVALDIDAGDALDLARSLEGRVRWLKVGMTLFYEAGPQVIATLRGMGFDVFLDLKLHDIPHQIRGAARSVAALGVQMLTVHAAGGSAMIESAARGAREGAEESGCAPPAILAVTVLTSMTDEDLVAVGVQRRAAEQVPLLAEVAARGGADGVVCSPREAAVMRELLGHDRLVVTPGVRPAGASQEDQSRVATPAEALQCRGQSPRRGTSDHRCGRGGGCSRAYRRRDGRSGCVTTPMTDAQILEAFRRSEAIKEGHFVLTSGRHSDTYVQCARVLEDPSLTTRLAQTAVDRMPEGLAVDLVAAPAVGGLIIGFAVAQALGVKFIFSEREGGAMVLRRSFDVPSGSRVLVVEDVVTTGGSVAELADLVRERGGEVVAVVSLIDRGGPKAFGDRFLPLLRLEVDSWDPASCGLCAAGVPVYSPGSRRLA